MHLVKWIRKNMSKLMAIFVIVIMIAFIMPSVLSQLAKPRIRGRENAMWLYGKDKKITTDQLRQASTELSVLRGLFMNQFLLAQQDIRAILLGQLLFPESEKGSLVSDEIKKLAAQNQLFINPAKIDEFFSQSRGRAELFFILLRDEAVRAGCAVPSKNAGEVLNIIIPQVTNNQMDAATLVKRVCTANNLTDDQGLGLFADVLAIMTYSRIVSDSENVTELELENTFARAKEKMDVEFVQFSADDFLDKVSQPADSAVTEQFEKYKNLLPGRITDDNPCGFGYKLPPRAALDYMIIKLDDLKKNTAAPTEEEAEDYYRQNLEKPPITTEEPANINDPNSEMIKKQKSYAEVADAIRKGLYVRKLNSQAAKILTQAIEQADAGFESMDPEKATVDMLKSAAGDYNAVAQNLSKEYDVKIYTGRTSLLKAEEIQSDPQLGGLIMAGQSRTPTRFAKLVFAVSQFGSEAVKPGPFEPSAPKIYTSIGPLSDFGGNIMAVARVVQTAGSAAPDGIGFNYQKNLPRIDTPVAGEKDKYVLRDVVAEDCKKLQAMEMAKKAAEEFAQIVKKQSAAGETSPKGGSWDAGLEKMNAAYGKKNVKEPNEKTFALETMSNLSRVSKIGIELTKMRVSGMVGTDNIVNQAIIYGRYINAFYQKYEDMLAKNAKPPVVFDFPPKFSCCVVKSFSVAPAVLDDFEKIRPQLALQEDFVDSQSIAIEHFMPDNITKRMNLRPVQEPNKPADVNDANASGQGEK